MPDRQPNQRTADRLLESLRDLPRRLHRDERGVISLLTVFVALMFTVILGMIVNVARHVDDRARMQNSADAAAYSGGVVVARGMNSLAFTNHLLSESFALTAYMRVASNTNNDFRLLTEPVLAEWGAMADAMENAANVSGVDKFSRLARAIRAKLPHERQIVEAYAQVSRDHASRFRGSFESVLGQSDEQFDLPIPQFQRSLVRTTPALAQVAASEIAGRFDGSDDRWVEQHGGVPLTAVMWRAHTVEPLPLAGNNEADPLTRTIPAVDPSPFGPDRPDDSNPDGSDYYVQLARSRRGSLARTYLEDWTQFWMGPYFGFASFHGQVPRWRGAETAKMSGYIDMMRAATRSELSGMLEDEFRYTNLPHVLRRDWTTLPTNEVLDRDHTYVGVSYWNHISEQSRGVFQNPLDRDGVDTMAFAQVTVFVPARRHRCCPWATRVVRVDGTVDWIHHRDGWPTDWDLFNQNWMAKLVPATSRTLPAVLSATPPPEFVPVFRPLPLEGLNEDDLDSISFH